MRDSTSINSEALTTAWYSNKLLNPAHASVVQLGVTRMSHIFLNSQSGTGT